MAEHKKPAKPKAEKAEKPKKAKAEEKPAAPEAKKEAAQPTAAPETAADVTAEAKPAKKSAKPSKPEAAPVEAQRENLSLDADDVQKPKIVKAKGAKNIHSGIAQAYATQLVAQDASRQAMGHGLKEVQVLVKGPGAGRESAVRALQAIGLDLTLIRDVTPVPHNGCRPPKQRRV